jgi:hypothetical protein
MNIEQKKKEVLQKILSFVPKEDREGVTYPDEVDYLIKDTDRDNFYFYQGYWYALHNVINGGYGEYKLIEKEDA